MTTIEWSCHTHMTSHVIDHVTFNTPHLLLSSSLSSSPSSSPSSLLPLPISTPSQIQLHDASDNVRGHTGRYAGMDGPNKRKCRCYLMWTMVQGCTIRITILLIQI